MTNEEENQYAAGIMSGGNMRKMGNKKKSSPARSKALEKKKDINERPAGYWENHETDYQRKRRQSSEMKKNGKTS